MHAFLFNLYIQFNMIIIKHYMNNRRKWDFDTSHTCYVIVF